jgi:hypothetical protein
MRVAEIRLAFDALGFWTVCTCRRTQRVRRSVDL